MQKERTATSIRVDDIVWKAARIYSIKRGITLTDLIERLLREELKKDPEIMKMVGESE